MATMPTRGRARLLTITVVLAVIFAMAGAVPAQESEEATGEPLEFPATQTINDDLHVVGKVTTQGNLGVGTTSPIEDITIFGLTPGILFKDLIDPIEGTTFDWHQLADSVYFGIFNSNTPVGGGQPIVKIDPGAPAHALELRNAENFMSQPLRVSDSAGAVAKQKVFELQNNGAPLFFFTNSATGDQFQFSMNPNGDFIVSALGTGGPEFQVKKNGTVVMGPGPANTFVLDPAGNLTIAGTLTTAGGTLGAGDGALLEQVAALEARLAELESTLETLTAGDNG